MPMGLAKTKQKAIYYSKQLINFEYSVLRENSQTQPCRIDFSVTRSLQQSLNLRFSCKALTRG